MVEQGKDFSQIYDLMGLRVIVSSVQDCYEVLGIVHTLWKPIPGRFKDYVAMPKSNMYQSLHTTVVGPQGEPIEIQIRTWEMHRTAEYGIAAHWLYKEDGAGDQEMREKVAWLRHLIEWQGEMKDTEEFMETLRIGLFMDEVFVFTPKGDVKNLPAGSTPVDFAYSIHTTVGHKCAGAKVNGRLVPLDYQLKNGDIVQIISAKTNIGPSRDWLQFVKTSKAKNRIRQFLREQHREENIQIGREMLERELRKHNMEVHDNLRPELLLEAAKKLGFTNIDDLLASVGDLKATANQVIGKLTGDKEFTPRAIAKPEPEEKRRPRRTGQGIRVKGVDDLLVRFSRCCNPVPGDPIIGFITRGKGVSVHRMDCPNLVKEDPERIIQVQWEADAKATYPVDIEIEATDRVNLLTDVMNAISEMKLYLNAAKARTKNGNAAITLTLEISHTDQIAAIYKRVRKVDGVQRVYRVSRLVR
jgi:GTP pyrophosphokinase